jgi:prevent-host-death family protein
MPKRIRVTELQRKLEAVLDEVAEDHVPYVLVRDSQPRAALVPYEEYLRFRQLDEKTVLRRFQLLRARMAKISSEMSEDEVAAEVESARTELGP